MAGAYFSNIDVYKCISLLFIISYFFLISFFVANSIAY